MNKKKPTSWRCKSVKQQKDKAIIYNSREWKDLRIRKLRANPLCERCLQMGKDAGVSDGWIRSAHCVHHIVPIETAHTMQEMKRLAFQFSNLQSLCDQCHADIHKEQGSHTKAAVRQREADRLERWKDRILARFGCDPYT